MTPSQIQQLEELAVKLQTTLDPFNSTYSYFIPLMQAMYHRVTKLELKCIKLERRIKNNEFNLGTWSKPS